MWFELSCQCKRRELLGFLICLPPCGAGGKRERWVFNTLGSQTSKMESDSFLQYLNIFLCVFVGFFALGTELSLGWLFFVLGIYFVSVLSFACAINSPFFLPIIQFAIVSSVLSVSNLCIS